MSGSETPGQGDVTEVSGLRATASGAGTRVSADVNGTEIFFESDDLELVAAPEVFASALLPAVVQRGWKLRMDEAPDPEWMQGAERILAVWAEWWGTPADLGDVLDAPPATSQAGPPGTEARADVALSFSGGLDSFYALLCSERRFDALVFGHGYDIKLPDERRMAAAEPSFREVAGEVGARAAVVRTNLRLHPPVRGSGWGRVHGGALAALGHACSGHIGELAIASTHTRASGTRWGSSWRTDPDWSSSSVRISHVGDATRGEKLRAVMDNPLVRRHLRVCWENRAETGNCGECEKCVRTMVQLHVFGARVEDWPFAGEGTLVERLDAVESVHPNQVPTYAELVSECADPQLRGAIERAMTRASDPWERRARRVRRREARKARANPDKKRGPGRTARASRTDTQSGG